MLGSAQPAALTPCQARVLQAVKSHQDRYGYPPTQLELATELGYKGNTGVRQVLQRLEERGFLSLLEGKCRGIRLTARGEAWEAVS